MIFRNLLFLSFEDVQWLTVSLWFKTKIWFGLCIWQTNSSTFFIEMREMSNIINNATSQSLVLIDELGRYENFALTSHGTFFTLWILACRGTSNYDGVGIAFSCAEFLISLSALTIFTTHCKELFNVLRAVNFKYPHTKFSLHDVTRLVQDYELHQLATLYPKANNFHLKVEEVGERLRYLYKVEKGSSPSNSYGL